MNIPRTFNLNGQKWHYICDIKDGGEVLHAFKHYCHARKYWIRELLTDLDFKLKLKLAK